MLRASEARLQQLRGNRIAMIFQDAMMTLNPVLRIDTQMIEAVRVHGSVLYRGVDRANLERERAREAAIKIQLIFQDPFSSLNPRMRIGDIIGEAPEFHGLVPAGSIRAVRTP